MGRTPYSQLWGIVDGAVTDAFNRHPDYLTPKGRRSAKTSVVKRVTGTVLSFAEESAKSLRERADKEAGATTPLPAPAFVDVGASAGASFRRPQIFACRIRPDSVRLKHRIGPITDARNKTKLLVTAKLMSENASGRIAQPMAEAGR